MQPVRNTIQRRLALAVVAAVVLAIAIATAASAWREINRYAEARYSELEGTAHVFASAVADDLAGSSRNGALRKLRAIAHMPDITFAGVEYSNGLRFAEIGSAVVLDRTGGDGTRAQRSALSLLFDPSVEVAVDIVDGGVTIGRLRLVAQATELRQRLWEGLVGALAAAAIAAAFGIAVAWRAQRHITRPIRHLTAAMSEVRETHDFAKRLPRESDDETGVMVDAFNEMLAQISVRDRHLAEHRQQLELKVEERTRDLREAKDAAETANVAKSEFLATMSHEIRTPMNGMLVMAELLSSAELAPRHQRYAEVVVKSGQSLLSIINDILDFSKIEAGKLELERIAFDPAAIVDDVLSLFWERAAAKGLDLAGYVAPDVPRLIEGDPVRLNQVLSNLVNNALKFTETGHVFVTVRRAVLQSREGAQMVLEFSVRDTGIGIAQDKLTSLFAAFSQADQSTTRKYGGTGLGLAICKRLVGAMGGEVSVTSTPGEGSNFGFTILTRDAQPSGDAGGLETAAGACTNAIVALDGAATAETVARQLRNAGIAVETVTPSQLAGIPLPPGCAVFADTASLAALARQGGSRQGVLLVCMSELGDASSDDLLEDGRAQDLLMRPVSRAAMDALIARLAQGRPLGRDATRRGRRQGAALPRFPGLRVLVADDSPVNREVIIEALATLQVEPDVVSDGQAAVEAASACAYDLILMDCSMPVMDGFAATRAIRSAQGERQRTPIVALTAHVAGAPADAWREAGMDDYVAKPFTLKTLADCFARWTPQGEAATVARDAPEPEPIARAADDDAPVIDPAVLDMIAGIQGGEDDGLVERVFGLYEQHAPAALSALAQVMRDTGAGNRAAVASAAHALKSMSSNVGAVRVSGACAALEAAAHGDAAGEIESMFAKIESELATALAHIEDLRASAA